MDKLLSMSKREIGAIGSVATAGRKANETTGRGGATGGQRAACETAVAQLSPGGGGGVSFEAPRASEQQPAEQRSSQTGGGIGPGALPRPAAGAGCGLRSDAGP